jgi:predicted nucleotidyltransferase
MSVKILLTKLSFCRNKAGKRESEILQLLKEGNTWIHSTFRQALAKALCTYLRGKCPTIKGIYIFGSSVKDETSFASDIDIFFGFTKKRKDLTFF